MESKTKNGNTNGRTTGMDKEKLIFLAVSAAMLLWSVRLLPKRAMPLELLPPQTSTILPRPSLTTVTVSVTWWKTETERICSSARR